MIKDRQAQTLFMNFENILTYGGRPSDIDMIYFVPSSVIAESNFLILGEIKNEEGRFTDDQKNIYEALIDNYKDGESGVVFYLTHCERWQIGSSEVDVADCTVNEYYYKHRWIKPRRLMSLNEAIPQIVAFHHKHRR